MRRYLERSFNKLEEKSIKDEKLQDNEIFK
jgi:hypothetical protein